MSTAATLRLHLPEEPVERRVAWAEAIAEGYSFDKVLGGNDGIIEWLWSRWQVLAHHGIDRQKFGEVATGYRRELWLWLAGERTWEQSCSGLLGRIERRISS